MKSLLLAICFLLTLCAATFAQEFSEELREIEEQLREAKREQLVLQQHLRLNQRRTKLLTEQRQLAVAMGTLAGNLERAEESGDEPKIERFEKQLAEAELEFGLIEYRLEILARRVGLHDLLAEEILEDEKSLVEQARSLLKLVDRGEGLVEQLFQVRRTGPESKERDLEEQLEVLEREFELRREVLQLKVELLWAREEDREEDVAELEEELRYLGDPEPPDPEPPDPAGETRNFPVPLQLNDQDRIAVGALQFEEHIVPLLRAACFECHNDVSASGDLNLSTLVQARPLVVNRSHWVNVIQQLKVRSMPPADAEQPAEESRRTMAAWLDNAIDSFDYQTIAQPGYEAARRLTHREYNDTVRDLTGIDLRPADRFPSDMTASSGFANSANSLFIQPLTLERYVGAAEQIVDGAWPIYPRTEEQKLAWRKLLSGVTDLQNAEEVKSVLDRFLLRAYRRPAEPDELAALLNLFKQRRQSGASVHQALRGVLQVVLVSPNFLIRSEHDGPQTATPFRVSDWELASRLSYFLWASMPDDELFALARSGRLREPEILAGQVERMLWDPKAESLGSVFAAQWLGFTNLGRVQPDQIDNPWATDSLITAMREESAMLFHALVRGNAPVDRLLDADYTFLNEELARHYRLEGVYGPQMRKVSLTNTPRRGILGHGSILAITSFPGRTSPVVRGNWILSELLGTPPPPPPPNVSEFDERVIENRRLTQKQKLKMHRGNPNCYACHSQIDPLGFALEQFEWFGRYQPERRGKPVDASGQLSGGTEFEGLSGLSQALLTERIDDFCEQLARKMLSYALGRKLEYYDEATVQDLVRQLQADDRRIQTLVHAIVRSDAFQFKQLPDGS